MEILKIADIGGTTSYWLNFPFHEFPETKFRLSLINLVYPDYDQRVQLPKGVFVEKLIGNACELGNFENRQWHIAHSNSVIEHVGGWNNISAMAEGIQWVSDYYFLQTPNFWFPMEPHFFIPLYGILPRPVRVFLQQKIKGHDNLSSAVLEDERVRLLTKREIKYLFPDGEIQIEWFGLFPKSIIVRSPLKCLKIMNSSNLKQ